MSLERDEPQIESCFFLGDGIAWDVLGSDRKRLVSWVITPIFMAGQPTPPGHVPPPQK